MHVQPPIPPTRMDSRMRSACWLILGLVAAFATVLPGSAEAAGAAPPVLEPLPQRIDAVFGRPVVFTLRTPEGRPPEAFEVKLDDGRRIEAHVQWVVVEGSASECGRATWLPAPVSVRAYPASGAEAGRGTGSWVVRIEFPLSAAGQGFWIGQTRYEPNWLPDPRRLASQGGGFGRAWNSPLPAEHRRDELLRGLIEPYRDDALQGWRYDLCTGHFTPGEEFDAPEPAGPVTDLSALRAEVEAAGAFEPVTEELAALERARWQVALARLWLADPSLSYPVREALAGAIETPWGVVPLWRARQLQLDDLLDALLRPRMSDEQRAQHVRAWLNGFESAVAWIVDDAGLFDAVTGEFRPTIGALNLDIGPVLAWARPEATQSPTDLAPIGPREMRMLRGEVVPGQFGEGAQTGPGVEVEIGRWSGYLSSIGVVIPVAPPGFALGPFRPAWTMQSWTMMDERMDTAVARDRATAAMLFRGRSSDLGQQSNAVVGPTVPDDRDRWLIYLEACVPAGSWDEGDEDFVELWFGPFGAATRAMRVYSDGRVVNVQTNQPAPGFGVQVFRLGDRWVARLPVPDDLIEGDGLLRIGVLRDDACGMRSSWPRRMLPGQREPGRVSVQTRAWDGFETP